MNLDILVELGIPKNEAKIYSILLEQGESSAGYIAKKSRINRRNVYDSLKRLLERGLVFEILQKNENHYRAVDPEKLKEILEEKQQALAGILPQLKLAYQTEKKQENVYIYQGIEGHKNYMRDILRIGQDCYTIGGKIMWLDNRIRSFLNGFVAEAKRQGIKFYLLFDHEIKGNHQEITRFLGNEYRFLSPQYSTRSAVDIFGDHVVVFPKATLGELNENTTLTVIINQHIADAMRTWFKLMWDASSP